MRATTFVGAALIAAAVSLSPQSFAAGTVATDNVPTVTRLVKLFLEREHALNAAVRSGDVQLLDRLLTDDFEVREGASPGNPVPRADWIRDIGKQHGAETSIEGMAVHDFGSVAIASYSQADRKAKTFVVDVWRRDGDAWKLAVRYVTPSRASSRVTPQSPEIPKKY